ncbi:LEAF RUST 10 DISEASE-RESISTANCE LOCUS RECEPTOR-LIKE PROTEIN KINASE-like protein 2.1 [Cinnamomum micranthum f. kanehirae]|uniref:non-specific serine/threonine protein kinase n=1 Tax=Cinnamomum micranthum f. kanehirae TaxID=337451 RepID=A0A3S3Q9W1_9MAGN|nr:LEAF RUST 10 DISEASE-RESISTANCE LOCUS RECEPTOR-LIKE PROTEIN KINASE-like protein 2.1 [Cinnamomum micranthum f. kanehirae]
MCHCAQKCLIQNSSLAGATTAVGTFLICLLVFTVNFIRKLPPDNSIFFWRKKTKDSRNVEAFLENYGSFVPRRYRYSELKKMTNSFKENLGQGGYGSVFKGKLNDDRLVTVKVLNNSKGGNGEEFINEVASIGRTYHVNVVALLGFCSEGSKRALVYEFMPKGSLEKFIYLDKFGVSHALDCQKLFQIAVGIARGLEYLHGGCSTRILHLDIKPHNILLDDDFCPKISDFGLAKLCPKRESTVSMLDARGTVGYIAPEVFCRNIGGVSHKSDVYSYGMMVLEMIGGRKNTDAGAENTSEIYFPHWIYKQVLFKESLGLLGFRTEAEEEIARKMVIVGLGCIQTDPTNRPSMSKVVEMLEERLERLQMPPKPYFSSPSRSFSSTT